jgi:hypothetical protein
MSLHTVNPFSACRGIRCAVAVGLLVLSSPALLSAQTERQSLGGNQVAVYNLAGRITVERGTGRDVEVEITRGGRDGSRLRLERGRIGDRSTLQVIYPDDEIVYTGSARGGRWAGRTELRIRDDGTWGGDAGWRSSRKVRIASRGDGLEAWADVRIRVPDGRDVAVYLAAGELTATDVDADLRLDVASARVAATGTRGGLVVDAGSGGVMLRGVNATALDVDNGSGGVAVTDVRGDQCRFDSGSGGITGDMLGCRSVQVDVGSGGVRLDRLQAETLRVDAGSGSVRLGLSRSPRTIDVDAGSGGVTLALPGSYGGDVDIETGSGGITTDFAVRTDRVGRNALRGTIGDGAGRLRVETGSGGVRLMRAPAP